MRDYKFCFRDFSGKLIMSKGTPFTDATGQIIQPVVGTPFIDGLGRRRNVGMSFVDADNKLIEPR